MQRSLPGGHRCSRCFANGPGMSWHDCNGNFHFFQSSPSAFFFLILRILVQACITARRGKVVCFEFWVSWIWFADAALQVMATLLPYLPVQADFAENEIVYTCLCQLIELKHPCVSQACDCVQFLEQFCWIYTCGMSTFTFFAVVRIVYFKNQLLQEEVPCLELERYWICLVICMTETLWIAILLLVVILELKGISLGCSYPCLAEQSVKAFTCVLQCLLWPSFRNFCQYFMIIVIMSLFLMLCWHRVAKGMLANENCHVSAHFQQRNNIRFLFQSMKLRFFWYECILHVIILSKKGMVEQRRRFEHILASDKKRGMNFSGL